ncbi:MAG TPA: hypothetical protein VH158_04840 [Gemmatimonadales bacterium]|nr:hypothetical protein [Gemmatimonadales bacterium]
MSLVLTLACGAGWHQVRGLAPGPLPARQQVEVWRKGSANRWHAVTLTADAVTGIPFLQPLGCDSCRTSVPRSEVDSIRLGNPVAGLWKTVGLILAIDVVALAIFFPGAFSAGD